MIYLKKHLPKINLIHDCNAMIILGRDCLEIFQIRHKILEDQLEQENVEKVFISCLPEKHPHIFF